eukprot:360286-Chlamydomonas_euryale.AAC.3
MRPALEAALVGPMHALRLRQHWLAHASILRRCLKQSRAGVARAALTLSTRNTSLKGSSFHGYSAVGTTGDLRRSLSTCMRSSGVENANVGL